jgi:hypothetical protein
MNPDVCKHAPRACIPTQEYALIVPIIVSHAIRPIVSRVIQDTSFKESIAYHVLIPVLLVIVQAQYASHATQDTTILPLTTLAS